MNNPRGLDSHRVFKECGLTTFEDVRAEFNFLCYGGVMIEQEEKNKTNIQKYREKINYYFDYTASVLIKYFNNILPKISNNWWEKTVIEKSTDDQKRIIKRKKIVDLAGLDLSHLLRLFDMNWNEISQQNNLLTEDRNTLKNMQTVRNHWSHIPNNPKTGYGLDDIHRDFDKIQCFLKIIDDNQDIIKELQKIRFDIMKENMDEGEGPQNGNNKELLFKQLCNDVNKCKKCDRSEDNKKNLSEKNGNLNSKVIFIALAPGKGARDTDRPLEGDAVGNNFEKLLKLLDLEREKVFITNTILCNAYVKGKEHFEITPQEIEKCKIYLERTIDIVDPDVIVTLGEEALNALKLIEKHKYTLRKRVATALKWRRKTLVPLYLMTDENLKAKKVKYKTTEGKEEKREVRNMKQQEEDFKKLKEIIKKPLSFQKSSH